MLQIASEPQQGSSVQTSRSMSINASLIHITRVQQNRNTALLDSCKKSVCPHMPLSVCLSVSQRTLTSFLAGGTAAHTPPLNTSHSLAFTCFLLFLNQVV